MSMLFNPYAVTGWLTSFSTIAMGLFVYSKKKDSSIHRVFFLFSFSIAQWSFFTALHAVQLEPGWALLWSKTCHIGAMMIPVFFYYFTLRIAGDKPNGFLWSGFALAILLIVSNFTNPLFTAGTRSDVGSLHFTRAGPLYSLMIIFFTFYVLLGIVHLYRKINISRGAQKKHLQYFFWASVAGYGIGGFNFCPVYGITIPPYPFSPLCGAIYASVIGYAILRHKLFDIDLVVKKGLVFGMLFGTVYVAVSGFIFLAGYFFTKRPLPFLSGISITIAMLLYEPLKAGLTRVTNSFLFQKKKSYTELIHTLTDKLAGTRDSQSLAEEIADFLTEQMALEWAALYLRSSDGSGFKLITSTMETPLLEIDETTPIARLVCDRKSPLILNPFDMGEDVTPEAKVELRRDKIEAIVPIFVENNLYGILLLGKKKSDDPFSTGDEGLLQALMDEVGMFFLSAKLLKEATRSNLEVGQRMKMAAVTKLARGVHHEVRNPLHAIAISANTNIRKLSDKQNDGMPLGALIAKIDSDAEAMLYEISRIENSLGRFAQFARPEEDFSLTPLPLKSELETFLSLMSEGQTLDKIRVYNNVPDDIYVSASSSILQDIFFNLFSNSYDAMQGKGELFFTAEANCDFIAMGIRDTGPGICREILPNIFKAYFTTKTNSEAVGIGLATVKHHMELLRGAVEVSCPESGGTEVIIKLRKVQPEEKPFLCDGF